MGVVSVTVELFRDRLGRSQVHPNDRRWMPMWVAEYASQQPSEAERLEVSDERVLCFLRSLRDRGVPAWQRLQAARAIEWYQGIVLKHGYVDFSPYIVKLGELAAIDRRSGAGGSAGGIAGEGLPGRLDPDEPPAVRDLRARMRVLHHPKSTEECYAKWLLRFIRHLDDERLDKFGEREIGQFLTDLAVTGEVTAGTQNQALSALIFYYGKVLGKDLRFIQRIRAKASQYLPVVLSKAEVMELLGWMRGESATMFQLMYGSGLRHRECRCLRIKDVCFDMGQIVVVRPIRGAESCDGITSMNVRSRVQCKRHWHEHRLQSQQPRTR